MGNSGIREFALRYDILRGGIKYAEAKAAGPAAVSMDMRRKIKRLFSGDLILPEGMDRLGDRYAYGCFSCSFGEMCHISNTSCWLLSVAQTASTSRQYSEVSLKEALCI